MLKGDLATTPFGAVISDLATSSAIGCLHVEGPDGDEALVYLKSGAIYSTYLPGRRPQLGARLISSGALAPEALEEALEAQSTELQGWRLGELLVHLGFVEASVVESFGIEQVRDACFELSRWTSGKWKFRKNEKTREDIAAACEVVAILDEILRREQEWAILVDVIRGTDSVPLLGAGGLASAEMALDQDEWALLCKVDGERNIHQLARDCGFTDFEAGQIVSSLVMTGLLEIDTLAAADTEDGEGAEVAAPLPPRSAAARLMAAFGGGDPDVSDDTDFGLGTRDEGDGDDAELVMPSYLNSLVMPLVADDAESVDESSIGSELARLLAARDDVDVLDDVMIEEITTSSEGAAPTEATDPDPDDPDPDDPEQAYTSYALPPHDPTAFADEPYADPDASLPRYSVGFSQRDDLDESLSAVSEALSALLGDQPAIEALSVFNAEFQLADESPEDQRARVIREAAAAEMSAAHAEMEEQRRRFDDARKRAEETARADAEAEQAVLTAERLATEDAARLVAEEEARVAAEDARITAEEQARMAAEEQAREVAEEAARVATEQEDARVAAEEAASLAAEEAARIAAEEAARIAAETAARAAAEEAERENAEHERQVAAEEAARVAAQEEAARHAQQQEADEREAEDAAAAAEEAARVAADEVARAAQEQEVGRLATEEAARLVEEEEAARVAAEHEAARVAAAEETARAAAAEEAARVAAELAAADALLDLQQFTPPPMPPAPPAPAAAPVMTDTASLMRELSSLGFDDEPAPTPAPSRPNTSVGASARQSAAQADKGKKRKGLFGRG